MKRIGFALLLIVFLFGCKGIVRTDHTTTEGNNITSTTENTSTIESSTTEQTTNGSNTTTEPETSSSTTEPSGSNVTYPWV